MTAVYLQRGIQIVMKRKTEWRSSLLQSSFGLAASEGPCGLELCLKKSAGTHNSDLVAGFLTCFEHRYLNIWWEETTVCWCTWALKLRTVRGTRGTGSSLLHWWAQPTYCLKVVGRILILTHFGHFWPCLILNQLRRTQGIVNSLWAGSARFYD